MNAMVACLALLSADAPICMDAHQQMYLCIDRHCRTMEQVTRDWRHSPKRRNQDVAKIYGEK